MATGRPARVAEVASIEPKIEPATLAELEAITAALPLRYRPMILLAAWCGLRFGELVELRRKDVDLTNGVLHVRRGAVRVDRTVIIGTPKTAAGIREVAIADGTLHGYRLGKRLLRVDLNEIDTALQPIPTAHNWTA